MSKKTLNKANLETLGAETLAALVMELVQGNAALQRRARMELSAAQGPGDVAADLRKRFASLRRATSFIGWRKQRAFVKDLDALLTMIETSVAPQAPADAFELLWSFLQLTPSLLARTDDSNGAIGGVLRRAMEILSNVAPAVTMEPRPLAERILDAVSEAVASEFDGIIPAMAETLGPDGLEHLKQITAHWAETPPSDHELDSDRGYGLSSSAEERLKRHKDLIRSIILADVADAQGDVDAYIARYSAEQLTYATIAPSVARRLLDADRVDEAHQIIERARAADAKKPFRRLHHHLDDVFEECLERLGQTEPLKTHLWQSFEQGLNAARLRKYLKLLPDFDDIDAEEAALAYAESYPHPGVAIRFLVGWPALDRAARVVLARARALDGNAFDILTPAADTLEADHPLAATVLRRAMIQDTLDGAKSKRYRHAARHLSECQASDAAISDYGDIPAHDMFVATLRDKHSRKHRFWSLVDG